MNDCAKERSQSKPFWTIFRACLYLHFSIVAILQMFINLKKIIEQ